MRNDSGLNEQLEYLSSIESYRAWLYDNYSIGNGHRLTQLEECPMTQIKYLQENDLPIDTELV
jgi:hypothetical protein